MIGRADIKGSKSNVNLNAWLPNILMYMGKGGYLGVGSSLTHIVYFYMHFTQP